MTSNLYPQYKKMQTLAREQLLTLPVGLPIKVKPIVNYILNNENFEIYTYKDYAKLEGFELTFDNIEKYFNSKDAKLVYNSNDDMYTLFYNSEMPSIRKAWTFAHKLGHYFAGHHFYIENDNVSKELNNVLEQEANCFARELLVPSGLVLYIADYYKSRDVISFYTILRAIFNLSKEASFYIARDLSKVRKEYTERKIYENYIDIIKRYYPFLYKKIFLNIPSRDDFYSWSIHYKYEYDPFSFYFYRTKPSPPSKFLKHYLFEKLIQSTDNEIKHITH